MAKKLIIIMVNTDPRNGEELGAPFFQATVAAAYERGRGLNMASYGEIDDVIDPADSRRWIATLFSEDAEQWWQRPGKARPFVDAW